MQSPEESLGTIRVIKHRFLCYNGLEQAADLEAAINMSETSRAFMKVGTEKKKKERTEYRECPGSMHANSNITKGSGGGYVDVKPTLPQHLREFKAIKY